MIRILVILFLFFNILFSYDQFLSEKEKKWLEKDFKVKIRVANWPPFQIYKDGKASGISVDYIKRIFDKYNIKHEFISADKYPFSEALNKIAIKNNLDLILSVKETEERKKNMLFSNPYLSHSWVIFTRKNYSFIERIEDLNGKTVSVENKFVIHEKLKKEYPKINLLAINSVQATQKSLEAVSKGKADAFVGNLTVGSFLIQENELDNLKVAAPTKFRNHENSMAIRNDWQELVSIINKEFNSWSLSDKNEIRNKYLKTYNKKVMDLNNVLLIIALIVLLFGFIIGIFYFSNRKLNLEMKKRKDAENLLKENNEKLIAFYNLSPLGLVLTDMKGNYLNFNKAFEKICGYTKEELKNLDFWELTPKKYLEDEQKQLESLSKTNTYGPYEKEYIQKDGTLIPINLNGIIVKNSKGEKFIWSIVEDISERKAKDNMLHHQNKLASMGEMIGNIAHQWRQPLSTITTGATGAILQKEMDSLSDSQLIYILESINDSAQYLSHTIDDFRYFFSPKNNSFKNVMIKDTISKTLKLIGSRFIEKDIEIIKDIENFELKTIENELVQVLINLLNNARDILIEKENIRRLIFISTYKKDDALYIVIKDNAGGIKSSVIEKIFEPYFTTKHKSQGTGIGLYMSQEIITKHFNGTIYVKNTSYTYENIDYTGAKFNIRLNQK